MNEQSLDRAADNATHAVVEAWEKAGFQPSRVDLETAMYEINDLLRPWMKDNLRQS